MSAANELDKDMLATLTDEERAAIQEESGPEELAIMRAEPKVGEDEGDDDEGDDNQEENAPPVEGKPEEGAPAAEAEPPAAPPPEPEARTKPRYESALPGDYQSQVDAIKTESDALAKSFRAGEIDFDEYTVQAQALTERRDGLLAARVKAEIAGEMKAQSAEQEWRDTVQTFMRRVAKEENLNYSQDAAKQKTLDIYVKELAADESNADKPMGWFLEEAHAMVKARYGLNNKRLDEKPVKPTRKPPLDALPQTLANVPGGDGPGDLAGEFTDLDGLEGIDLEQAIARMTPAQREKYAALA